MRLLSVIEKTLRYRRIHGTRKLIADGLRRIRARHAPPPIAPDQPAPVIDATGWITARELVEGQQRGTRPLRLFTVPAADGPRVSLVTDSINRGSLYGGVGTALIFAALVAEARGARLRVVTRTERAHTANLTTLLDLYGIALSKEPVFAHAPSQDREQDIDTLADELYVTTSWWTTSATLAAVPPDRVVYLLQEDERMFYPFGDDRLRCAQLLERPDIRVLVNTRLLFDHLVASGLPGLADRGRWFEPAFPSAVYHPRPKDAGGKRTLMFYARPNNPRNLFLFGVELIETAIDRGVLSLDDWDIVLVGKSIPKLTFDDGRYVPKRLEQLSWAEYADLVGRIDLGVCLMYTPHPSYPPLDLAASGAVVVTNRFGVKQHLDGLSRNIVCGDLSIPSMLTALAEGCRLAADSAEREANYRASTLDTGWPAALADAVAHYSRMP